MSKEIIVLILFGRTSGGVGILENFLERQAHYNCPDFISPFIIQILITLLFIFLIYIFCQEDCD